MERFRSFLGSGCCMALVLSLAALTVACALGGILLWQAAALSAPAPTLAPSAPTPPFSPVRTPVVAASHLPPPTIPPLSVAGVTPPDGSEDVDIRTVIEVTFDRPVVDPESDPDSAQRSPPLTIRPPVEGGGRWITTDTYQFRPRALSPATRYTITIPAGTAGLEGATLPADYVATFSTMRPTVRRTYPRADALSVAPTGEVRVVFSMPMDRPSTESCFRMATARRQSVEGTFDWVSDQEMIFIPDASLARSTVYQVTLDAGARAAGKVLGTSTNHAFRFTVAEPPHVVDSAPADGDMAAHPGGQLAVRFNMPMDTASVEAALRIEPQPEYVDLQ